MLKWLGLRGNRPTNEIQMWEGARPSTKWIAAVAWAAISVLTFVLLKNGLPSSNGFLEFLPLYGSIIVFIAGMSVTERSCVRIQKPSKE